MTRKCLPPLPTNTVRKRRLAMSSATVLAAAVVALVAAVVGAASDSIPPVTNIEVVDGPNAGEVFISWDAVPAATHYRIGYVNMDKDYDRAKNSPAGDWKTAFIYVDEDARNLPVSGGRVGYTLRRLAQGDDHVFTVLTGGNVVNDTHSLSGDYSWPQNPRWQRFTTADRGGVCLPVIAATASADVGGTVPPVARTAADFTALGSPIGRGDPGPPPDVPFERRHITLDAPAIGALPRETGRDSFAGTVAAQGATQSSIPATDDIRVVDGPNPGEVIISWNTVLAATHYRIGYVNMDKDYDRAKNSPAADWKTAFSYVDEDAQNLPVSGGRVKYTIRRLAQGDNHALTVLTGGNIVNDTHSLNGDYSWPQNPRWQRFTIADHGGACPGAVPIATPPAVVTSLAGLKNGSWLQQNRPQAAAAIRGLPWLGDGIDGAERQAAEALISTAIWYPYLFTSLMQMSWLGDGVTDAEAVAIRSIRATAFWDSDLPGGDLAGQMLRKSWVQDAISADEATVLRFLRYIVWYDTDSSPPRRVITATHDAAGRILAMPFLTSVEGPDALAVSSLERIEDISKTDFLQVMSHPALNDGITDEEAKIVLMLGATYQYADRALVDILLDPARIVVEERRISLPRSGEVDLAIIRAAPGAARSIDILEHSVRGIEELMGTPFPTNYIAALFAEEAVLEGAAGVNFGTHVAMLPAYDVDDGTWRANFLPSLMTHEVAHYYWRGNETWIDEGSATFLEFPVENTRTGRALIAGHYPCAYVSSIAEVVALDPKQLSPADICNHSLGERIFLDLYRSLGDPAFRRGFRSLYQRSQVPDEYLWPTELSVSHVRDAFQPLAPAASAVITSWYDGPGPRGIAPPDTGPVNPELTAIAGGRVVNAFVSLEDDWEAFGDWESFISSQTEKSSVSDAAGKHRFIYLAFTLPATADPKILRLEVIEHYEDGFLYGDRVASLEFEPEWSRVRAGLPIGPGRDDPWLSGHYGVYVYDGERKVAEVTYQVAP